MINVTYLRLKIKLLIKDKDHEYQKYYANLKSTHNSENKKYCIIYIYRKQTLFEILNFPASFFIFIYTHFYRYKCIQTIVNGFAFLLVFITSICSRKANGSGTPVTLAGRMIILG